MRHTITLGLVLALTACGGSSTDDDDDGDKVCEKPTSGRYAITRSGGQSELYLLGFGDWDLPIGLISVDGANIALDHIKSGEMRDGRYYLRAYAGPNAYELPTRVESDGKVHATFLETITGVDALNALAATAGPIDNFVAAHTTSVWCFQGGAISDMGVMALQPYTVPTGIQGSCNPNGPSFAVQVIANDGVRSALVRTDNRDYPGPPVQDGVSEPVNEILHGFGATGWTLGRLDIYVAASNSITRLRRTSMCIDEQGNSTLNGAAIANLVSVE